MKELLTKAYEITDNFACKGIQVEQMAALRDLLRQAYKLATAEPEIEVVEAPAE